MFTVVVICISMSRLKFSAQTHLFLIKQLRIRTFWGRLIKTKSSHTLMKFLFKITFLTQWNFMFWKNSKRHWVGSSRAATCSTHLRIFAMSRLSAFSVWSPKMAECSSSSVSFRLPDSEQCHQIVYTLSLVWPKVVYMGQFSKPPAQKWWTVQYTVQAMYSPLRKNPIDSCRREQSNNQRTTGRPLLSKTET